MRGEDQKHPGPGEAAGDPWLTIMADKCFSPAQTQENLQAYNL